MHVFEDTETGRPYHTVDGEVRLSDRETHPAGLARLGFGSANFSARLSASEALVLLERALDCGISHFDTARMYGDGSAEGILGKLARRRRAEMTIVSKAGITPRNRAERALEAAKSLLPGSPDPSPFRFGQFEAHQIRRSVETSLRELQTDHLDALLLHEVTPAAVTDELRHALIDLKQQGKVRRIGIATSAEHSSPLAAQHPELCEIIQIAAPAPGLLLPQCGVVIEHSVLGSRLLRLVARLDGNAGQAKRCAQEFGVDPANPEAVAGLLLRYEMARNQKGVVLFSSSRLAHIEKNAAIVSEPPDNEQYAALERFLVSI